MIIEIRADKLQNFEEVFLRELFIRFRKEFSNSEIIGLNQQKMIRFPLLRVWFKGWRFNKREADYILRKWDKFNYCKRIPYVGVKINGVGD